MSSFIQDEIKSFFRKEVYRLKSTKSIIASACKRFDLQPEVAETYYQNARRSVFVRTRKKTVVYLLSSFVLISLAIYTTLNIKNVAFYTFYALGATSLLKGMEQLRIAVKTRNIKS